MFLLNIQAMLAGKWRGEEWKLKGKLFSAKHKLIFLFFYLLEYLIMEEHLELCRITFTTCHVELLRHEKKEPVTTDNEQANLNPQKMIKFSRDRKLIQASS